MAIIFPDDTLLEASSHRRGSAGEGRGERGREEEEARRLIFLLFVNLRAEREKFFFGIQTVVLLLSPPYPVEFTSKMMERVSPCVFHGGELLPDYRLPPSLSFFHPTEIEIVDHNQPSLPHHCFKSATQFSNRRPTTLSISGWENGFQM